MAKKLKSLYGEGIGSKVQITDDPNEPTFDSATHVTDTDKTIGDLLREDTIQLLTVWEREFLMNLYGQAPLTRRQHIGIWRIKKKYENPQNRSN